MRKFIYIFMFFTSLFLISCEQHKEPLGTKPTKPFTINEYLGDNAVYKSSSTLNLNGISEDGVIIKVELINQNDKVIDSYKTVVNEKTLKWNINLSTPKASSESYSIKVTDSYNVYSYEYKNIRFGQLWLVAGDMFDNKVVNNISKNDDFEINDISFFNLSYNSGWLLNNEKESINDEYIINLCKKLYTNIDVPIGIILGNEEHSNLEEWLPLDSIDNVENILDYVKKINKYSKNPSNKGDAGYLFESKYKKLEGIQISGITWNHGSKNLDLFNSQQYSTTYFQMLTSLFECWHTLFNCDKIGVFQLPSYNVNNCHTLRYIQNIAINYYTYVKIIPTVDLFSTFNNENSDIEFDKLAKRAIDILNNKIKVSSYANLVLDINKDNIVDKIKIEFNNTENLILKDEDIINYLVVKYKEDGIHEKEIDVKIKIENNNLIFDLSYEEITTNESLEEVVEIKYYNKDYITIYFATENDISLINIFNDDMIPLLPFIIVIE